MMTYCTNTLYSEYYNDDNDNNDDNNNNNLEQKFINSSNYSMQCLLTGQTDILGTICWCLSVVNRKDNLPGKQ